MRSADQARQESTKVVNQLHDDVARDIAKVIDSAISQGSFKATFYPKNQAVMELAVAKLKLMGYGYTIAEARDQRDKDAIHIIWS